MLLVLIGLTAMPSVWALYSRPKPASEPAGYPPNVWPLYFVSVAFGHNRRYGLWFMIGLLIELGFARLSRRLTASQRGFRRAAQLSARNPAHRLARSVVPAHPTCAAPVGGLRADSLACPAILPLTQPHRKL